MPYWHTLTGGCLMALTVSAISYLVLVISKTDSFVSPIAIVPGLCVGLFILVIWRLEHVVKTVPKGKIGILLAISADGDEEAKRIQVDFTRQLETRLKSGRLNRNFVIVKLPAYWVTDLENGDDVDANEKIRAIIEKTGAHFFLRGYSRRRLIESKEYHLLNLRALVRHERIPQSISAAFAKDMSALIPEQIRVAVDGDAVAFESTSAQLGISTRYTIAVAAALSGALLYSEELLLELEQEIKAMKAVPEALKFLEKDVPVKLIDVYANMVRAHGEAYHMKRSKSLLEQARPICEKLLQRDPDHYSAKLQLAIVHFVLNRDIEKARGLLNSCKSAKDATYRYSLAFLLAYEGKLKDAHDLYRTAFHAKNLPNTENVPLQTEEFIHIVIREEPDKNYLLFCTGLINYNAKQDFAAAKNDFEQFLRVPMIDSFPWAKDKATELLRYCARYSEA